MLRWAEGFLCMNQSVSVLTRVVDTSLDDVIQGVATGCLLVPHLAIEFLGQDLGHVVVVLGQVGELLLNFVVEFEVVVGVSERHGCFLTLLKRRTQGMSNLKPIKDQFVAIQPVGKEGNKKKKLTETQDIPCDSCTV